MRVCGLAAEYRLDAGYLEEILRVRYIVGMITGSERNPVTQYEFSLFSELFTELTIPKAVQLVESVRKKVQVGRHMRTRKKC